MNVARKTDAEAIRRFLQQLEEQFWLGPARCWWPKYLFRVDNIDAAARILNTGKLFSRAAAQERGIMTTDSASPDVISHTPEWCKQYVRLYFRPRTPTQYSNEGFRPRGQFAHNAHCPVPVVMLFDSAEILTRADTLFSDGNLAAGALTGSDLAFLRSIPFDLVYHDQWFDEAEKRKVIFHRHAEVIIPGELDLSALRLVQCRTQAEYETLLHLLTPTAYKRFATRIGVGAKANLHFRHWTFVDQVELSRDRIRFYFNPSTRTPRPFHARAEILEEATGTRYHWEREAFTADDTLTLGLGKLSEPDRYIVRLTLDGHLAYANRYVEPDWDLPF